MSWGHVTGEVRDPGGEAVGGSGVREPGGAAGKTDMTYRRWHEPR